MMLLLTSAGTAIKVVDGNVEVISEGRWKLCTGYQAPGGQ